MNKEITILFLSLENLSIAPSGSLYTVKIYLTKFKRTDTNTLS